MYQSAQTCGPLATSSQCCKPHMCPHACPANRCVCRGLCGSLEDKMQCVNSTTYDPGKSCLTPVLFCMVFWRESAPHLPAVPLLNCSYISVVTIIDGVINSLHTFLLCYLCFNEVGFKRNC